MKKYILILRIRKVALISLLSIGLPSCIGKRGSNKYNLESIKKISAYEGVIDSPDEALAKAKVLVNFETNLLARNKKYWTARVTFMNREQRLKYFENREGLQLESGIISEDKFKSRKEEVLNEADYWKVVFKSKNLIPSYSCVSSFTKDGMILEKYSNCGYNK